MSSYVVHVLAPDGLWDYLSHGRRVRFENAHRYQHPSAAKVAAEGYRAKHDKKGLPTEAKVLNREHLCLRCEHDFGEVPDPNFGFACEDYDCPIKDSGK